MINYNLSNTYWLDFGTLESPLNAERVLIKRVYIRFS